MISLKLGAQLSNHVFAFIFVFARTSAALTLFPGLGESFVSNQVRLFFALSITFLIFLPLAPIIPVPPTGIADLALMLFREVLVGVFFGSIIRLLINVLETAGAVISLQIGLSNAQILSPTLANQSALPSAFLSTAALAVVFISGLDHFLLRGLIDTYNLFPPNSFLAPEDMVQTYITLVTKSFEVGVEIAAPFLIIGIMLYVVLGFIQRLMPSVQLFLVITPIQIWGGMALFSATFAMMLSVWLNYFNSTISDFLNR